MNKTADNSKENFIVEVRRCVKKKNWKQILQLSRKYGPDVTAEYLWVFPTENCLLSLENFVKSSHIISVLSIGCGHGLLEFVIKASIGLDCTGLEVDKSWWSRRKPFLPLNYIEMSQKVTPHLLLDMSLAGGWNFALMFCYFNSIDAFNTYVDNYRGNFIIIIGPAEGTKRYSEPLPCEFQHDDFTLVQCDEFGKNRDLIAYYARNGTYESNRSGDDLEEKVGENARFALDGGCSEENCR